MTGVDAKWRRAADPMISLVFLIKGAIVALTSHLEYYKGYTDTGE